MVKARFKRVNRLQRPRRGFPISKILPSIFCLATIAAGILSHQLFLRLGDTTHELNTLMNSLPDFGNPLSMDNNDHKRDTQASHAVNSNADDVLNSNADLGIDDHYTKSTDKETADVVTIGYFISVTGCGSPLLVDGAAVVKHSIHLASIHGDLGGKYDYKMHAIYHPVAKDCVTPLADLGYDLVERETPVALEDIQGEFLRRRIVLNGCCGEKELIKLEAYTFTDFPVVVHVDVDTILLKPLDPLFDAMINPNAENPLANIDTMRCSKKPVPSQINAFFTLDYGVVNWNIMHKPVQGGLLILRPDKSVYDQFVEIVKKGDFREGKGWAGTQVGPFYGAMTIQGLLPYYYDILHPGETVDLNHCVYNQMSNNPRDEPTDKNGIVHGKCRTNETDCEDCRSRPLKDIASFHFTICQKPWLCLPYLHDVIDHRLCRKAVGEWYRIRSRMEKSWGRSAMGPGKEWKDRDHFFGYCKESQQVGYLPIEKPYGAVAASR